MSRQEWNSIVPGAWMVQSLLTKEECQRLQQKAIDSGIEGMVPQGDTRHRYNVGVVVRDESIRDSIYQRIKDHVPQQIVVEKEASCSIPGILNASQTIGTWNVCGISDWLSIRCYPGKGHLAAHRDGDEVLGEHKRSFLTINGYLTDRPIGFGGATRFLRDDIVLQKEDGIIAVSENDVIARVEADQAGKAVVFLHGLMHDGEPLGTGSPPKWLFRCHVIYERNPSSAPQYTPEQTKARQLLQEAEVAEEEGRISDAIQLYKRAYRLDKSLETPNG